MVSKFFEPHRYIENIDCHIENGYYKNILCFELKAQEGLLPIHDAILLSYMQMLQKPKGILINFHCANIFKEGQKTLVNDLFARLPDR